jgi:hypothetical protein
MATPSTIVLRGKGIRKERVATAVAITPGELLEIDNGTDNVQAHSTAAANAQRMFAVENEVVGKGIDDDYAASDNVLYEVLYPGSEVYALLPASAAAIVRGDFLESNGDGTLRKVAASAATSEAQRQGVIAVALEDVDNSLGGSRVRIKAELL